MRRFDSLIYFVENVFETTANGTCDYNQFDNVNSALTTFNPRDQRLVAV